jgi:hypothetical protein
MSMGIFQMGLAPACPACTSSDIESWEVTDPVGLVDIDASSVSNFSWRKLSRQEKMKQLRTHLLHLASQS